MAKKRFWKEFKKQTRMAIAASIGFVIAFAWKDYIISLVGNTFNDLKVVMPNLSAFLSAILLTFIGVILILISSKMLE